MAGRGRGQDVVDPLGGADTLVPPQMGEYLHAAIPGSRLTALPDEGHTLYIAHWPQLLGEPAA